MTLKSLSLSEIQARFSEVVRAETLDLDGCADIFENSSSVPVSLETRIGIYHHAYFARILESLADDFPTVRARVNDGAGDSARSEFENLVRAYLDFYPSRYFGLAQVGRDFPGFLAQRGLEGWADLAEEDWARCLCRWSESTVPTHFGKLLELDPESQLRQVLELSPNARFVKTKTASKAFFKVHGEVKSQELSPSMEELISEIQAEKTLGELITVLGRSEGLAAEAMSWISKWVSIGLISGFHEVPSSG